MIEISIVKLVFSTKWYGILVLFPYCSEKRLFLHQRESTLRINEKLDQLFHGHSKYYLVGGIPTPQKWSESQLGTIYSQDGNMFKLFQATNQLYQLWNHIKDPHKVVPPQVINGL